MRALFPPAHDGGVLGLGGIPAVPWPLFYVAAPNIRSNSNSARTTTPLRVVPS